MSSSDATLKHGAEFRRCLLDLDVRGIRKVWRHVSPHLDQPATDADALHAIHLARVEMKTLPKAMREYSQAWLKERETRRIARAVAIGVGNVTSENNLVRLAALVTREAMVDSVLDSVRRGIDLETESDEIRRRLLAARKKTHARR